MYRSLSITLAIMLAYCLAAGHGNGAAPEVRSFPVQPGDTLVIQNDYGHVRVEPASGSTLEARITRRPGTQAAAQVSVFVEKRSDRVFVYCFFADAPSESVDIEIWAPTFMNLTLWGANPEVSVRGLQGTVRLQSWTGDITTENLTGAVTLIADQGDIIYRAHEQPRGDVHLETTSGTASCELDDLLNGRLWLRAGGKVLLDTEAQGDTLEKQLGTGGPLIHAVSLRGDVRLAVKGSVKPPAGPVAAPEPPGNPPLEGSQAPPVDQAADPARPERPPSTPASAPGGAPQATGAGSQPSAEARPPAGTEGSPTFKVNVDWVFLNASVRDRYTNRSLPDLGPDDFEIYEDGMLQEIGQFENAEAPFHLLLLLDTSGSTRSFIELSKEASIQFTSEIKANDRIGAAAFNSDVTFIQDFTNDRGELAVSIRRLRSGGGTAFYDALMECVNNYMNGIQGRKAIVVFTDGVDNRLSGPFGQGSRTPFEVLFRRIQEIDTIIYPIFLDTEDRSFVGVPSGSKVGDILGDIIWGRRIPRTNPTPLPGNVGRAAYREAYRQLQDIADQTGGRMYAPRQIGDLSRVYSEIADDLRVQYWIGYSSTNRNMDGRWRQIVVKVKNHANAVARTRKGYYARPGQGGSGKRAGA